MAVLKLIKDGQALLVFHNTTEYDDSGVAIGAEQSDATILAGMIKQVNQHVQDKNVIRDFEATHPKRKYKTGKWR